MKIQDGREDSFIQQIEVHETGARWACWLLTDSHKPGLLEGPLLPSHPSSLVGASTPPSVAQASPSSDLGIAQVLTRLS